MPEASSAQAVLSARPFGGAGGARCPHCGCFSGPALARARVFMVLMAQHPAWGPPDPQPIAELMLHATHQAAGPLKVFFR